MDAWGTIIGGLIGGAFALAGSLGTAYINRKSEERRQEQQLEHSTAQMLFEDRKISCRTVIDAMYKAVQAVESNQPWDDAWHPLSERTFEEVTESITKSFLFLGAEAEKGLKLFLEILSETVLWDPEKEQGGYSSYDKDKEIRRAYDELRHLSDLITAFLRSQIHPSKEEVPVLKEIALLEACRFVTDSRFEDLEFPNRGIIKLEEKRSPMEMVRLAKENPALFKSEFNQFRDLLETNPLRYRHHESVMQDVSMANRIMNMLS